MKEFKWSILFIGVVLQLIQYVNCARCKDPSEYPITTDLTPWNDIGSKEFAYRGSSSGCHFHFFNKAEILQCMDNRTPFGSISGKQRGKHIFMFGGSTASAFALNLFQLLNPQRIDEPSSEEINDWFNCGNCGNLLEESKSASSIHMVFNRNGKLLGKAAVGNYDDTMLMERFGNIDYDNSKRFMDLVKAIPLNASEFVLRVTFVRTEYYSSIFDIVKYIREDIPMTGKPIVVTGVRHWWYYFCWYPAKFWCPNYFLENESEADVKAAMSEHMIVMMHNFKTKMPDLDALVMDDDISNPYVGEYLHNAYSINSPFPFRTFLLRTLRSAFVNISFLDLLWQDHPQNVLSILYVIRWFNFICENEDLTEEARNAKTETIQYKGGACTRDNTLYPWHFMVYEPCDYEVKIELPEVLTDPPTNEPTGSPTNIPTRSPTKLPTRSPVGIGETSSPTATATDSPTKSPTIETKPPTFAPTNCIEKDAACASENECCGVTGCVDNVCVEIEPLRSQFNFNNLNWNSKSIVQYSTWQEQIKNVHPLRDTKARGTTENVKTIHSGSTTIVVDQDLLDYYLRGPDAFHYTLAAISIVGFLFGMALYLLPWRHVLNCCGFGKTDKEKEELIAVQPVTGVEIAKLENGKIMLPKTIPAIAFVRFIASTHIVCGHLANKNRASVGLYFIEPWYTNVFGFTWVPWFMMVSGFVLAYSREYGIAKAGKAKDKPWYIFVYKRLLSIYPLYVTGLIAATLIKYHKGGTIKGLPLFAQFLLLQAWIPTITVEVVQAHCWFLSCVLIYWALNGVVNRFLERRSNTFLWLYLLAVSILPWLFLYVIPCFGFGASTGWDEVFVNDKENPNLKLVVVVLKFHPVSYFHIYISGAVAAQLLFRYFAFESNTPKGFFSNVGVKLVHFGGSIGLIALYTIFLLSSVIRWPVHRMTFRLGVLAPFQLLLLVGLSVGRDPLAKLFSYPLFKLFGKFSYPQYIFQFVMLDIWARYSMVGFWTSLLFLSLLGYVLVQKPIKTKFGKACPQLPPMSWYLLGAILTMVLFMPLGIYGLFVLGGGVGAKSVFLDTAFATSPDHIVYSNTARDMTIPFSSVSTKGKHGAFLSNFDNAYFINPSFKWDEQSNTLHMVTRVHSYYHEILNGEFPTTIEFTNGTEREIVASAWEMEEWVSDVALFNLKINSSATHFEFEHPRFMQMPKVYNEKEGIGNTTETKWKTCYFPPTYLPLNNTVHALRKYGVEDPRIFKWSGKWYLSATSLPKTKGKCEHAGFMNQIFLEGDLSGDDGATSTNALENSNWFASALELEYIPIGRYGMDVREKNWIAVVTPDQKLFYIRSFDPFVVVQFDAKSSKVYELFRYRDPILKYASTKMNLKIHGGANAVYVEREGQTPYYLATFHSLKDGRYINFAIELEGQFPFKVKRISNPLPLVSTLPLDFSVHLPMTFCSGLEVFTPPGESTMRVLIGYGSSNAQSRILTMTIEELDAFF